MYTVIFDENLDKIDKFDFNRDLNLNNLKKTTNIHKIDDVTTGFMNSVDYSIMAYYPLKNSNDFYLTFANNSLLNRRSINLDDVKGACLSEVFLNKNKDGLIKKMREVYDTGNPIQLYGEYYENNIRYNKFIIKIVKVEDNIFVFGKDRKDYSELSFEQEKLFENQIMPIAIFQNDRFVKCNKFYLKSLRLNSYDDVIGKPLGYTNLVEQDNLDLLKTNIKKIIDGKLSSYVTTIQNKIDGVPFYFDIDGSYIVYKGEPAALLIFNNTTEFEENKIEKDKKTKEALILQENMDLIESVSNTCSAYVINGEYIRSKELYKILERDPYEEDETRDILWDIVVDEDRHILEEAYAKRTPDNDFVDFIIRINTGRGNIKYIHGYIKDKYMENNRRDVISFYQDVTKEELYLRDLKVALDEKDKLLKDREMLLAEVHHRVKNNLQIVLSLINLNKEYESDPKTILNNTENRIYTMALLHEKIYGSNSLSTVNIKDYIESLVTSLLELYSSSIKINFNMQSYNLNMEQAIPMGLIINELTLNTIKYAFPNKEKGNLYIEFKEENKHCTFIIQDDGIGLPEDFDLNNLTSLGLIVVQNLTLQLMGTLSILEGKGTGYKIEFNDE